MCNAVSIPLPSVNPSNRITSPAMAALHHGREHFQKGATMKTKSLLSIPEYRAWTYIRRRCNNPNHNGYENYGGKGIKVCARWNDFALFLADMGRKPSSKHSIERRDSNKDYEPSNCCWATFREQNNNRSTCLQVEYNGVVKTLDQWCEALGLHYDAMWWRINHGWSVSRAFTQPLQKRTKK